MSLKSLRYKTKIGAGDGGGGGSEENFDSSVTSKIRLVTRHAFAVHCSSPAHADSLFDFLVLLPKFIRITSCH